MQHPFFNESLVEQRMQILRREAEMARAASSLASETDEKDRSQAMIRIFGLACFGFGLLTGSLLMWIFGLLPVVIAAGCICVSVTLPVLVFSRREFVKNGVAGFFLRKKPATPFLTNSLL